MLPIVSLYYIVSLTNLGYSLQNKKRVEVLKEYGVIPSDSMAEAKIFEHLVALEKDLL